MLLFSLLCWLLCLSWPAAGRLIRAAGATFSRAVAFLLSFSRMPVAELVIPLLILGGLAALFFLLIRPRRDKTRRILKRCLAVFSVCIFLFTMNLGVQYTAPPIAELLGIEVGQYTPSQLARLTEHLRDQLNAYAGQQVRNEKGELPAWDFEEQAQLVVESFSALWRETGLPRAPIVSPKRTRLWGKVMSYVDVAGIYLPLTAEAIVSADTVSPQFPFCTAHEAAHAYGVGPEDEANFMAFLVCTRANDVRLLYSAYFNGYIYAANALYRTDPERAEAVSAGLNDDARIDLDAYRRHLAKYETPVRDLGGAVNDLYIKATGQPEGARSYGKVVDLLIAYYEAQQ